MSIPVPKPSLDQPVPRIAFVTTCKGRLHHLKETLPLLVSMGPEQIIVVDYGCPDGTGEWVRKTHPEVTLVSVSDDPGFCASRARNLGAGAASTEWICFIDADIRVDPAWLDWIRGNLQSGHFYRAAKIQGVRQKETWGTVICQKTAFQQISGYDEVFRGWGGEDDDLYFRLVENADQLESAYPAHFISAISHDDEERTKFHQEKNKELQMVVNRYYRNTKHFLMGDSRMELPASIRESLMLQISDGVKRAFEKEQPHPVRDFKPTVRAVLNFQAGLDERCLKIGYRRRYVIFGPKSFSVTERRIK